MVLGKNRNLIIRAINKTKRILAEIRKKILIREVRKSVLSYGLNTNEVREKKIIISLTSYPDRFKSIYYSLKSLLRQDMKPDRIILWYDCDVNELTDEMKKLSQYGIEYVHVNTDIKPHKKYFYAFKAFPKDLIITVDDDIIYPSDLVSSLYNSYLKYPDCVSARRVHLITTENNTINPYSKWKFEYTRIKEPNAMLFATNGAGTLFPPGCVDNRALDISRINCCLYADDIWLKCMELLKGTRVVWAINNMIMPPNTKDSQERALFYENVEGNRNDKYIRAVMRIYGTEIMKKWGGTGNADIVSYYYGYEGRWLYAS